MKKTFVTLVGLFCIRGILGAPAESDGWVNRLDVADRSALAAMNLKPEAGGTLRVRLRDPSSNAQAELVLRAGETRCRLLPVSFFSKDVEGRIMTYPCPAVTNDLCWFTFRRTENAWTAYVDDVPVVRLPELWSGKLELQHGSASQPAENDVDDYTQRLGSFKFEDNFLVPAGSEFPPTWEIMGGIWKLHSVTGSMSGASGGYQLARQPKPEKSPNFYTLEGGGTNAVVLTGEPFYSRYVFRASVQHNGGTNGIVFLAGEHGGFFGFTARTDPASDRLILELWRQPAQEGAPRVALDAVQTELPAGQWLLLETELLEDRIICRADNIEVIRRRMPLPPGGRFGLFSNMPDGETTRFDDVVASTHEDLFFETPGDVAQVTRDRTPGMRVFHHRGETWFYAPPREQGSGTNRWTYGAESGGPLHQEAFFVSTSDAFTCGLTTGATGEGTPFYRFSCRQAGGERTYQLERVTATNAVTLDQVTCAGSSNRVTLALDALRPYELRCYADQQMVCFDRPAQQPGGLQSVFASAPADLFFAAPTVLSRDLQPSERFEKNPLYVNDPYMRHWASPEGQWVTFKDGLTWFKGDLTGPVKVRLPVVNGMELHLCIPEGSSNGLCRVSVKDDRISVFTPDSGTNAAFSVASADVPEIAFDKTQVRLFTVGIADRVVWLGGDEVLLDKAHLAAPMRGRKMRISGMTLENLSHTLVKRDNVFDTLFNESLYNWTINGGRWEVINRFYCEPTWSHMNGESSDSLAALWSKYVFAGDFSIEFYAGMRMGWYERPGDLNLTVMSRSNNTGDGYTAIATGWDPDHSQLYSRLLRNGAIMDVSTKYLVPRARAGLTRQGYQPLVAAGRDIHGAWYGMQLRRVGTQLQYVYDNEQVFDVEDKDPLQDGSLGIWTYRNSMMVARIKIAAESIKPRPFAFKTIPAGAPTMPEPAPMADSGVRVNGRAVQPLAPEYWQAYDTVSHPSVRFRHLDTAHPEMRVTSILGGGTFLVRSELPPAQPDKLLGWRFEIARHPKALVNFEFSTVKDDGKGGVEPAQGWSYVLSGSDETRGPRKIAGKCEAVPPSEGTNLVWTPVEIWVPSDVIRANQAVQIDGFGNLQPSDVQQGLLGNPPHAWYAIRNFREIHRGTPVVTAPPEKRGEIAALTQVINGLRPGELQMVEVPVSLDARKPVIEWAVPELADFGLRAQADASIPGSILVTPVHPWPSPMLPPKRALADAQPASFTVEGNGIRVLVPYETLQPGRMTLALELSDGRFFRQVVSMRPDENVNYPPVLLKLEMPEGGIETFESRPFDPAPYQTAAIASIDNSDPVRGGVLEFRNAGVYGRRLDGRLVKAFNAAATPVLQFRYKGDSMANVSLAFGPYAFTFSEVFNTHVRFGNGQAAPMDNTWRVWTGMPFDSAGKLPLAQRVAIPPAEIRMASRQARDQTGFHSTLCIDDIACGPAVGPNRPFAFKADFADPDGVAEVAYAILDGPEAFDNRTQEAKQKAVWVPIKNAEVVQPDLATINDGFHHLIVKARDGRGAWSEPSDLPFICDRIPPKVTTAITPTESYNGSCLSMTLEAQVAPPVINNLRLVCLGTPLPLATDNGWCAVSPGRVAYEIDWIWLLRRQLAAAKNGDVLPVIVDGIVDASGNAVEPVKIEFPVNLEADKRPPTILPLPTPPNALWFDPAMTSLQPFFTDSRNLKAETVPTPDGRVVELTPSGDGQVYIQRAFAPVWDPDKHPWLAISYRMVGVPDGSRPFTVSFNTGPRRPRGIKDAHVLNPTLTNHLAYITGDISGKAGEWHDILINVRDFLRDETEERKDTPDLTYLTFYLLPKAKTGKLQIRALSILAPWNSDQMLPVKAYDLSGIKGLEWSGGLSEATGIRPANVALPAGDANWFRFRIGDRRGNMADTWSIPIPPGTENTKVNLPGLEVVNF